MRSRTVSRPWSRCRLTLSAPPISRANASRRARSSSSGFQVMRILRLDDLIGIGSYRKSVPFQTIIEEFSGSAFKEASDRRPQCQKTRRRLLVQPLLVIHRGQKADRDHNEGLV